MPSVILTKIILTKIRKPISKLNDAPTDCEPGFKFGVLHTTFETHFFNEKVCISIKILLKIASKGPINNIPP